MNRIAMLPIKGVIISEETSLPAMRVISSIEIVRYLERIKKSKAIKALVLEINSPEELLFRVKKLPRWSNPSVNPL